MENHQALLVQKFSFFWKKKSNQRRKQFFINKLWRYYKKTEYFFCKCCKTFQYPKSLKWWLFGRKHWWSHSKRYWRSHPSILATASEYKDRANCSFSFVSKENVLAEIKVLDASKTIREGDIPVNIVKANDNLFAEAICFYFNKSLEKGKLANCLKLANITPVFK